MRRTIWRSGFDITKAMLDWSEDAAGIEFQDRMLALTKSPGVCVTLASDDKLLPRSSSVDSNAQISPGLAVDASGALAELSTWYSLSCVDADVGKYIQIQHATIDSVAVAHSVSGVASNTKRDLDTDGDTIISKVTIEDPSHVTLGKITACSTGNYVTVNTTRATGHRQLFSTYEPAVGAPPTPVFASGLYTGYDEDLIDPSVVASRRFSVYGGSAYMRVHFSGSESDAGIDCYEIMLVPMDDAEYLTDQALLQTISADLFTDVYDYTFHGLRPGTKYVARVRARDATPTRTPSSWAQSAELVAGYEVTPNALPITLSSDSLRVIVSWTPGPSLGGYELCWKMNSDAAFDDATSQYALIPPDIGSYAIPAASGNRVYVHMRVLNRMGVYSVESSGSEVVDTAPPIPIGLQVSTGADESYRTEDFKALEAGILKMTPQAGWIFVQWGETGTSGVGSTNAFYIEGANWPVNKWTPAGNAQYLIDSIGTAFLIQSNTSDTLVVDGTPASGSYFIGPNARYYDIKLEYYDEDGNLVEKASRVHTVLPDTFTETTPLQQRISGLVMGRTYKVSVASLNSMSKSSRSSFCSSSDVTVGVTGYTPLVMSPLTLEATNYGMLVKWPLVENVKGYELVYTIDGTPPDFGSPRQPLKRTHKLNYPVFAPAGALVRVKARCYDKSGLVSSNVPEGRGYAGGISTRQNIKVFAGMRMNLTDSDTTQARRTIAEIVMPSRAEITKIEVNIISLSDGPQKIRVYEDGQESGAVSLLVEETGFVDQIVSLNVAYNTKIVIDAWDVDWNANPPSSLPTILGSVNVHYNEGTVRVFSQTVK